MIAPAKSVVESRHLRENQARKNLLYFCENADEPRIKTFVPSESDSMLNVAARDCTCFVSKVLPTCNVTGQTNGLCIYKSNSHAKPIIVREIPLAGDKLARQNTLKEP